MPSDYDRIRNDEKRKDNILDNALKLLGKMYSDNTHFIFELLQNAEDAGASKVLFHLFEDKLEIFHNGKYFNKDKDDVRGICGVGEGTKSDDLTQIGRFGIGFKSVYAYTNMPEIYSGNENFKIKNFVHPYEVPAKELQYPWTTLFVLPFNRKDKASKTACHEISERLSNLNVRTLLFLRKIKEIEYRLPNATGGFYLRQEEARGSARQVSVIGQNKDKEEEESWFIFERPVPVPGKSKTVRVEVSFRLEAQDKAGKNPERIIKIKDSPLVVFFPTEKETRFGFLVQGPYRTTPSRDNIPKDDEWNKMLVKETSELIRDIIPAIKDLGLLSVSFLEALPIRTEDFPTNSMFYPIVESVRNVLREKELLPADDGSFVSAENAKLAGADLRKLLSQVQLGQLFQSTVRMKWLSGEITQDRTPDLRSYLISELDVEEVTPDGLARRISHAFLSGQPDKWFVDFYGYLSGRGALWKAPLRESDPGGILRSKPILRLANGSQEAPFKPDGTTPNAFLPPPEETSFPVVHRSVVTNEQACTFLKQLGLSEPDIFDDIVENVLPKYDKSDVLSPHDTEHAEDIDKILRSLTSDSEAGKKKVIKAAKQTPFLKSINQSGQIAFKKPLDIYLKTDSLKTYFSGDPEVWFLSESKGDIEWLQLGVSQKPRFIKIWIDLNWDEKRRLRGRHGHTKDIEITDYDLDGLNNFLSRLHVDKSQFRHYGLIIWSFLLEHLNETSYYSFYEGKYKWFYYQEREASFEATWMKRLRSVAWMPKNGDDAPHRPEELSLSDLPVRFVHNEKLADILCMKVDSVSKLAEELGIKAEDIKLVKKHYEEFQRWKAGISKKQISFPQSLTNNHERREEKLIEQFEHSPEKKYELRERRIRTTRNSIDEDTWLRNKYTIDDQMICQICKYEMPFKKRNGQHYFESVEAFPKDHFSKEHEAQFLALCPLCAAMYKEFIKKDQNAILELKNAFLETQINNLNIKLGEYKKTIQFHSDHFSAIRTIIKMS